MKLYIKLNTLALKFQILDNPVAQLWIERMNLRGNYPLNHPDRFYGFNSIEEETRRALMSIQYFCNTINEYQPIITRRITDISDQDTLNYLHNIFERYHGLLDQQSQEFWNTAPEEVQEALANLNLAIHRCESIAHGNQPRFVCTWYGMPKTETLTDELMRSYGTLQYKFGEIYLNYAEIGKTLEDLTIDRDNYIGDDAFKPFNHYSADFNVRFYDYTPSSKHLFNMQEYFNQHSAFFNKHGYTEFNHPRLLPLRFPVAQLVETMPRDQLIDEIKKQQTITEVYLE